MLDTVVFILRYKWAFSIHLLLASKNPKVSPLSNMARLGN